MCATWRPPIGIDPVLHIDIGKTVALVEFDNFLPAFFQRVTAERGIQFNPDRLANGFRFELLRAVNFDFAHDRACLHHHDHFHAVAFGLAENPHVLNIARSVKRADVLFDGGVGIWLAHFCAHLREDPLATDVLGTHILNLDRVNHDAGLCERNRASGLHHDQGHEARNRPAAE